MSAGSNAPFYSQRFFDSQSAQSLASARVVLQELLGIVPVNSAVDVGCGVAPWLRAVMDLGVGEAIGLDGDYVDRGHLFVDADRFRPCNLEADGLRQSIGHDRRFDLAICMEVVEHLSPGRAASFVAELCGLGDTILFSAAVPGQGGINHVNEQWPVYWEELFRANGFVCFDVLRPRSGTRRGATGGTYRTSCCFRERAAWQRA